MKSQNMRDLERQWSDQAKKAAKKMSGGKQPTGKPSPPTILTSPELASAVLSESASL